MALRINTNVAALNAHRNMIATDNKLSDSLERLSTGLRINKAADDASGMAIADALKAQHLGIGQAIRNANDGISIVQTADGALQESINIINTIKTKSIQAASDGQTSTTRTAIQNDINKLMEELSTIAKTTSYNGQKLLSGAFTNKQIQIGAFANETASLSIGSTEATKMGHITQANLSLASEAGGEVQLTVTSSITGEELTLNTIDIQSNNSAENGIGALADEVNRYASTTGISASAVVTTTSSTAIQAGTTGSGFAINGINIGAITVVANDSNAALVNAINGKTSEHGVTAAIENDGTLTLTSSDGRAIEVTGSISDVFGSTSSQMSTLGYLSLTQKGVSQFQINGIGAGATGQDITISADVTTVDDSILAAGSTIKAGSMLAAGTIVGGDTLVESSIASTSLDFEIKAGSSLYSTTQIAQGTTLGGSVVIGGDTSTSVAATAIATDMFVAAGSTLEAYSVLGKGTVITTEFTQGTTTYEVGDTLTSALTLSSDYTVANDMTLKYNGTSSDNSAIKAQTVLAKGSTMGIELEIGVNYNTDTSGAQSVGVSTAISSDLYLNGNEVWSNTDGNAVIKAGSLLADNSTLALATDGGTWAGPTLVHDSGTLKTGDTFAAGTTITLLGDQVISEDLVGTTAASTLATAGTMTLLAGSIVTASSVNDQAIGAGTSAYTATLTTASISDDMTLKAGSELATSSKLLSGSELGDNTYVMGGTLDATLDDITTYARTELKAGSLLQATSVFAEGSTIGGAVTTNADATLDSDMTITAGTTLVNDTLLKAGTTVNQDITLSTDAADTNTVDLKAGDVLTTDLYVGSAGVTLSADMTLKEDSVIKSGTVLAINTANSGSVGLSDTESFKLSDLNVLTQEGAQRAIDIAEASLADLDKARSGLGSVQNQLVSTISNLSVTKTNIQASESAIRDVDFAEEASTFSKMQLLAQTGSYALAQANASSQNVLSLLQ
jgi:flagellin